MTVKRLCTNSKAEIRFGETSKKTLSLGRYKPLNHVFMKKSFLLISLLLLASVFVQAQDNKDKQPDRTELEILQTLYGEPDRSGFVDVNAYYYSLNGIVEVEAYGIGTADIYVVDDLGKIVNRGILTSELPICTLTAPESDGIYTLVIWSESYYGEALLNVL